MGPLRGNVLETDNLMEKLLWVDGHQKGHVYGTAEAP